MKRLAHLLLLLVTQLVADPALADPGSPSPRPSPAGGETIPAAPVQADSGTYFPVDTLASLDIGGSFRFRSEAWVGMDLGLTPYVNRYGTFPQFSERATTDRSLRTFADIRLRLEPTLNVGERGAVRAVVDLFDAMAGQGGSTELASALYGTWGMPAAGELDSPLDSSYVRMLWGELYLYHLVTVQFGRIPAHWGMGIVENAGIDPDAVGGDAVDGIGLVLTLGAGYQAALSIDYPLEGATFQNAYAPWGAGYDAGDLDDIWQMRLKVQRETRSGDGTAFSWGLYARFRWQDYSSLGSQDPTQACGEGTDWQPAYPCVQLFWRDAFLFTPDAFARLSLPLSASVSLDLEAEIAGRYGSLSATQQFTGHDSGKTLYGLGGVARSTLSLPHTAISIEVGAASGDEGSLAFGVLDRFTVAEPDDSAWESSPVSSNSTLTSFTLHPNFLADLILFRREIGAVTNALYVKPGIRLDLFTNDPTLLWVELTGMYARAFVPSATPGNDPNLGVETDLTLGLRFLGNADARFETGILYPLAGLAEGSVIEDPLPWTGRLLLNVSF